MLCSESIIFCLLADGVGFERSVLIHCWSSPPLPPLKIEQRSPQRSFDARLVPRKLAQLVAIAGAEAEEDEIDLGGLLGSSFAPGAAGALEQAALDAVSAAEAPGIDGDALGELMLHRAVRFEGADELGIEPVKSLALLIEQNDALGGETVLQGIAAGDGAACFGARAGAAQRIAAIGFDLQKAGHFVTALLGGGAGYRGAFGEIAVIGHDDAVR